MENKELIVVGSAFALIVTIAMYMFVSQQKNNNAVVGIGELKEDHGKQIEQLNKELSELREYVYRVDSIYHKNAQ